MSPTIHRPSERRSSILTRSALAVAAALLAVSCGHAPPPPPPPQVTVAPAIARDVAHADEFNGTFEAVNAVDVRPRVSGYVERVSFTEGAIVRQGDVLFVIDPRPYQADVARAQAALEQARTRRQLADAELERAQRLVSTQAISREELDARTSGRAEGDAAIHAAEAALRIAQLNLEWTVVRAPISGRVGRAEVTPGNLVQVGAGAPRLTTIVSIDPIYVYFNVDEQAYLDYLAAAPAARRPVHVGLANESDFPHAGTVDFIDNRVDRSAGTMRVRAVLPNHDRAFAPGLYARVRLVGRAARPATMIQDRAIGTDQDRKFVLVLKADSTVDYRAITLGPVVDGLRVVQSGLAPGEDVVVNGLMRVRPGMKVSATASTMTTDVAAASTAAR